MLSWMLVLMTRRAAAVRRRKEAILAGRARRVRVRSSSRASFVVSNLLLPVERSVVSFV